MDATCDIAIIGGGTGGVAAALAATSLGYRVIMTEEFDWVGGQLTSQAVPPDEHPWIESHGCTLRYRDFRNRCRRYYSDHLPLTPEARANPLLNPGGGWVSRLCVEPRIAHGVLASMLAPSRSTGLLQVWQRWVPVGAKTDGDRVQSVTVRSLRTGEERTIRAAYFLDATEIGDLLPLTETEYVSGQESRAETGEPSATEHGDSHDVQGLTWCFAMGYDPNGDHRIAEPQDYAHWRDYVPDTQPAWPGKLLSWTVSNPITWATTTYQLFGEYGMFSYRQIVMKENLADPNTRDVTMVNWAQNDCFVHVIDASPEKIAQAYHDSRALSTSLLYWLQTEAPREDGGHGYPGLYFAPDFVGTDDGLAMAPYHRESRRIRAEMTVTENHVGVKARNECGSSEHFEDSVGIGAYRIDLHPSATGRNSVDLASYPFQIPLGALLPMRMENLLPACKNLGVTHITNGCYRLHPVEWNIGEVAGLLSAFALNRGCTPRDVRHNAGLFADFQTLLRKQGVEVEWPSIRAL